MGFFFSNFHVCKTAGYSRESLETHLAELFAKQGFLPAKSSEDADLTVSVYDADGKWASVCSDGYDFYTDESIKEICIPISEKFDANVMTISCFDSDCLFMNLIDHKNGVKAIAKIGRYPEIKQRSTPARWKEIVEDIPKFKALLSNKHTFAEEALEELSPVLGLDSKQGYFCTEMIIENEFSEGVNTLYFTLPETAGKPEPPNLMNHSHNLMPCEIGKNTIICAFNIGGKSRGLAIAFSGSYVENEDIWFRDVQLEYNFDRHPRSTIPLQLEKRQADDGQWIYYAEIPQFQIPSKVKEGLHFRKVFDEQYKRTFGVRFTPEGNRRKVLDITVHFIPMKNPEGQYSWCVWSSKGSKKAYIENFNRGWNEFHEKLSAKMKAPVKTTEIKIEDFDIDD